MLAYAEGVYHSQSNKATSFLDEKDEVDPTSLRHIFPEGPGFVLPDEQGDPQHRRIVRRGLRTWDLPTLAGSGGSLVALGKAIGRLADPQCQPVA